MYIFVFQRRCGQSHVEMALNFISPTNSSATMAARNLSSPSLQKKIIENHSTRIVYSSINRTK